jgi:hypothetical protein
MESIDIVKLRDILELAREFNVAAIQWGDFAVSMVVDEVAAGEGTQLVGFSTGAPAAEIEDDTARAKPVPKLAGYNALFRGLPPKFATPTAGGR